MTYVKGRENDYLLHHPQVTVYLVSAIVLVIILQFRHLYSDWISPTDLEVYINLTFTLSSSINA